MNRLLKSAALIFMIGVLINFSCQKELSCENCPANSGSINLSPIAIAGPDQAIFLPTDSLALNGSASNDPDGTISSFQWTKISGPASLLIANMSAAVTVVKNLAEGAYQFELKVTDNGGLFAKDTMQVIVNNPAQPNRPPVANAGTDQTITLPTNNISLDGSASTDPDNNITSYAWTKISGPPTFTISIPNAVQTQVTNLIQGIYQFELKVTDAGGLFSKDTVQIIVSSVVNNNCDISNRPLINAQLIPVATMPSGTGGYFATIGNKMYFLTVECSNCEDTVKSRAYFNIYDVIAQTWSVSSDYLMTTRGMGAIVTSGNKIIYAGGYNTDGTFYSTAISDVDIYDVSTNTWSATSLSARKYGMASAVVNSKIFFGGGYEQVTNGYLPTNKVEIYDLSTNLWSITTLSEARTSLSAITLGSKIYFAGGINGSNAVTKRVDVYDNSTSTWSIFDLQEPKAVMTTIAVGNKIYWAGGVNENRLEPTGYSWVMTSQVEIKDISTGTSLITCLFQPNVWLGVVLKNNKIVYFGGGNYYAEKNKFDIYDLTTSTWSIGVLPQNTEYSSITSINDLIYVVKGNQVWKLEF